MKPNPAYVRIKRYPKFRGCDLMQLPSLNEKIIVHKDIFNQLYTDLKWKADKRILMLIAAMYVTSSKEFDSKQFLELADYIKTEVGFFSHLKTVQRFTTAATLDTTTSNPKKEFQYLLSIYEKLIENGFGRTVFTYIAAGTLLKVEPSHIDEYIKKSSSIYKGMKERHFFLTNSADYPLATILALTNNQSEGIVDDVEANYQALRQVGFSAGNDLQFLSHILTLDSEHLPSEKAEHCLKIKTLLDHSKFKTKRIYYPYIGMLSFLKKPESELDKLFMIVEVLNKEKQFKWNKEINFMMSVLFLMDEVSTLGDAVKIGLNTTIETIIQAQQAAMTVSITAATVDSSSSSGDS